MALIDSFSNTKIKAIIEEQGINPPKYWVDDEIYLDTNWKDIHIKLMKQHHPELDAVATLPGGEYNFKLNQKYKILKKFLYSKGNAWWSYISDENGKSYYFFDDCFKPIRPTLLPKTFVYESFDDFNKQIR